MLQKWVIVVALLAVVITLLAGAAGYEVAKNQKPSSVSYSSTTYSYQPSGPTLLEQSAMGPQVSSTEIEPATEPIKISPLPEAMLQLLSLKEGQVAPFHLNGTNGKITKGCYDKWNVSTSKGTRTYETWGDLTTSLFKLALNAKNFAISIHGKTFHMANSGPRLTMHSAQGDSFDLDTQNHPPIYSGIAQLEQTA